MKRGKLALVALLLGGSLLFNSCIGSFGMFNRLCGWNQNVGNKFVNELVFLAFHIIPVYEISYLMDVLVINSIEFWSGSNPMLSQVGEVQTIQGENGEYLVTILEDGYSIAKVGETATLDLIYDTETNTWNAVSNGESTGLVKMNDNGTAELCL